MDFELFNVKFFAIVAVCSVVVAGFGALLALKIKQDKLESEEFEKQKANGADPVNFNVLKEEMFSVKAELQSIYQIKDQLSSIPQSIAQLTAELNYFKADIKDGFNSFKADTVEADKARFNKFEQNLNDISNTHRILVDRLDKIEAILKDSRFNKNTPSKEQNTAEGSQDTQDFAKEDIDMNIHYTLDRDLPFANPPVFWRQFTNDHRQVLNLLAEKKSLEKIAEMMEGKAIEDIYFLQRSLFNLFRVNNNEELIATAKKRGLIKDKGKNDE